MRALILAAGLGQRMGELTRDTPKPLLKVGNHYLIEYAISNLKRAGITEIVINVFYYGEKIKDILGNGERYGVNIIYSHEQARLEVGGGLVNALPLLGSEPFVAISSDVITDFPLAQLPNSPQGLAHLVLVDNPPFHPEGDFGLSQGKLSTSAKPKWNFAGIAVYRPELFAPHPVSLLPWGKIVMPAVEQNQVTGEYYKGIWYNIGTPEDLHSLNQQTVNHLTLSL